MSYSLSARRRDGRLGKSFLRLDCADLEKLINVYRSQKFEVVGDVQLQEDGMPLYKGVKMQLAL
jgi:hypothetical protein